MIWNSFLTKCNQNLNNSLRKGQYYCKKFRMIYKEILPSFEHSLNSNYGWLKISIFLSQNIWRSVALNVCIEKYLYILPSTASIPVGRIL